MARTYLVNDELDPISDGKVGASDLGGGHARYTDAEAVAAMGVKGDANALNHDKYTDAQVDAKVATHTADVDAHHAKYTDAEAVTAMGVKGDANALNHDKYTDAEAVQAVEDASALTVTSSFVLTAASNVNFATSYLILNSTASPTIYLDADSVSPTASGYGIGLIRARGRNASGGNVEGGRLQFITGETWSDTTSGAYARLYITSNSGGSPLDTYYNFYPTGWYTNKNGLIDIGNPSFPFKDLHLSGDINLGADTITEAEWTDLTDGGATTLHSHTGLLTGQDLTLTDGSGYASIEMDGSTGSYIDLHGPTSVDYGARIQVFNDSGGTGDGQLQMSAGDHRWYASGAFEMYLSSLVLRPATDNGLNLGDSSYYWNNGYISTLYSGHQYPKTTDTYSLGTSTNRWHQLWLDDYVAVRENDAEGAIYLQRTNTSTGLTSGQGSGTIFFSAEDNTGVINTNAAIIAVTSETQTPTARGSDIRFYSTANGSTARTARWYLDSEGDWLPYANSAYTIGGSSSRALAVHTDSLRIQEGTSFPGSPWTGEQYKRTDIRGGITFEYNGTYWLSVQEYTWDFRHLDAGKTGSTSVHYPLPTDVDVYLTHWYVMGRNASAAENVVMVLVTVDYDGTNTTIDTLTVNPSVANYWTRLSEPSLNTLIACSGSDSASKETDIRVNKNATTNTSLGNATVGYRLRAT
jgi:hypothetical protein